MVHLSCCSVLQPLNSTGSSSSSRRRSEGRLPIVHQSGLYFLKITSELAAPAVMKDRCQTLEAARRSSLNTPSLSGFFCCCLPLLYLLLRLRASVVSPRTCRIVRKVSRSSSNHRVLIRIKDRHVRFEGMLYCRLILILILNHNRCSFSPTSGNVEVQQLLYSSYSLKINQKLAINHPKSGLTFDRIFLN